MHVAPTPASRDNSETGEALFPYGRWYAQLGELRERYTEADPFPHLVLDEFLQPDAADRFLAEFPPLEPDKWINWVHVNERKYGKIDRESFGPTTTAVIDELTSPAFLQFLTALTDIQGLFPDSTLESAVGGGLHQSQRGGFLNIHADFTVHPHHRNWARRVNLLLYLNRNWHDEYGGHLEFWDREMQRRSQRIAPIFNRCVIFRTDEYSHHGHPEPMTCPEDMTRKSLALYYFTKEKAPYVRSTEYRARPGDGARSILIYADKMVLRAYDRLRRLVRFNDRAVSRLLGSLSRRRRG